MIFSVSNFALIMSMCSCEGLKISFALFYRVWHHWFSQLISSKKKNTVSKDVSLDLFTEVLYFLRPQKTIFFFYLFVLELPVFEYLFFIVASTWLLSVQINYGGEGEGILKTYKIKLWKIVVGMGCGEYKTESQASKEKKNFK